MLAVGWIRARTSNQPSEGSDGPARITVIRGGSGSFEVGNSPLVIGRGAETQIRLDHDGVSREHCRLDRNSQGQVRVTDLGSTNGTLVNGERVESAVLQDGDRVGVGPKTVLLLKFVDIETTRRYDLARGSLERTLNQRIESFGARDPRVAESLELLGSIMRARGELAQAVENYARASAIFAGDPRYQSHRARTLVALGSCRLDVGDPEEAAFAFRQALELFAEMNALDEDLAPAKFGLARALETVDGQAAVRLATEAGQHYRIARLSEAVRDVEAWLTRQGVGLH